MELDVVVESSQSRPKPLVLNEEAYEINHKTIRRPFVVSMPNTSNDFGIICDILEPSFIAKETEEYGGKDYVSAIAYKINEYYRIRRTHVQNLSQKTLFEEKSGYKTFMYLDSNKLKIIDPNSEFLRIGNRKNYDDFLGLPKIPEYLKQYLIARETTEDQEGLHNNFWNSLFSQSAMGKKIGIAHYISWNREIQIKEMHSDIFLPPVPYIKNLDIKNDFIRFTKEINDTAFQLYGQESALYLIFDMALFKDSKAIADIANILSEAPNRYIVLKILGIGKLISLGFGYYPKKTIEFFLHVLNDVKQYTPEKLVGFLDGGGFGYCLLGSCADFFTDTVSNAYQDSFPKNTGKHRGLLHPITLTTEPISGIIEQLNSHGSLFIDCSIAEKYRGFDEQKFLSVDKGQWSIDARKMGLIVWQKRMSALMNTHKFQLEKMRFDEILNSDFAVLGRMVKNITNGT